MKDSHEIILRLFASIVRVNKLTKLEPNRGRQCASSLFLPWLDLGLKLYGFMTYLSFLTITKRLVRLFQNWASFYVRSLEITVLVHLFVATKMTVQH
jgi:hypothetical protein